jgi:hypothetical protein
VKALAVRNVNHGVRVKFEDGKQFDFLITESGISVKQIEPSIQLRVFNIFSYETLRDKAEGQLELFHQ